MTTELSSLPVNPSGPTQVPNVMSVQPQSQPQNLGQNMVISGEAPMYSTADLDKRRPTEVDLTDNGGGNKSMEEIMQQVQKASNQGITNISRVPTHHSANTQQFTNDPRANVNNIEGQLGPSSSSDFAQPPDTTQKQVRFAEKDYISSYEIPDTKQVNSPDNHVPLLQEFKVPILVGLLYYIFDMPNVKRILLNAFPKMFKTDANLNDYGALLMAVVFGVAFYVLTRLYNFYLDDK